MKDRLWAVVEFLFWHVALPALLLCLWFKLLFWAYGPLDDK